MCNPTAFLSGVVSSLGAYSGCLATFTSPTTMAKVFTKSMHATHALPGS